ncbi:MAG TPA: 1,2-phenylacetyl-CoA epoxidase subunit PaaE [Nocardioides sp.]|uniref:1,2-phenylacetyl-CoA epoxidase subunit PaaE n=1 Tax=Nocardioides sp. TaxID=35761 RepID=UPI002D7FCC8A|nr:1,2-phenylacetyl-CoA epoxidase subunit PaaE [Nocardioides sp.]HET6653386.1 1,2-phenylacetyl-CoA epoxidase subunit PaaE [Nocardioides sp.]
MSHSHSVFHPLTIASIEPVTDDSVAITFDVPDDLRDDYAYSHGQHLTIRTELAGDDVRRNYSICSPVSSGQLRVAVKRLPGGAFSEHALDVLKPGDVLDVMTPSGRFFTELDPEHKKHYVCIAAGSGITPVLSIVATTLETEPESSVTLLYGNRTHKSVMFLEDLEDLKDTYPQRFHLVHVLSREPQEVELFSGRLDVERLRRITDTVLPIDTVDEWFLCGPFEMVSSLRTFLVNEGVSKRAVHAEIFHVESTPPVRRAPAPGADAAPEGGADVTITLDGRTSSFRLATDGPSVLEAALTVRADAPFACKGGVCGTCRAKVLEGSVEMDTNWALEPDEVEKGYVLTCQSHPTSDTVVVDYDA